MPDPQESLDSIDERALIAGLALLGLFALSIIAIIAIYVS